MHKCKNCNSDFIKIRPLQKVCSYNCGIELNKKIKSRIDSIENKKKLKELNQSKLSYWKKEAKFWFQRWIRLRDVGKLCISCDTQLLDIRDFDAGHYYKAEIYLSVICNEVNVNGQCKYCNKYLHGNLIEYRKELIKRNGIEVVEQLDEDSKNKKSLGRDYYMSIADSYKKKCKEKEKLKDEYNN